MLGYFLGPKFGWFLTPPYTTFRVVAAPDKHIYQKISEYPLEFISDSYRFIRIIDRKIVHWEWQFTVLNKSDTKCKITVTFILIDKNGEIISSSMRYGEAMAESTITLWGEGTLSIDNLARVSGRVWDIKYEKSIGKGYIPMDI